MVELSSLLGLALHFLLALGINEAARYIGLTKGTEFIILYFMLLSFSYIYRYNISAQAYKAYIDKMADEIAKQLKKEEK